MKAKPIEPGCRAYIVPSNQHDFNMRYAWLEVEVIRETRPLPPLLDVQWWIVNDGRPSNLHCPEPLLLRIDGHDIQSEIENEQELVHV